MSDYAKAIAEIDQLAGAKLAIAFAQAFARNDGDSGEHIEHRARMQMFESNLDHVIEALPVGIHIELHGRTGEGYWYSEVHTNERDSDTLGDNVPFARHSAAGQTPAAALARAALKAKGSP